MTLVSLGIPMAGNSAVFPKQRKKLHIKWQTWQAAVLIFLGQYPNYNKHLYSLGIQPIFWFCVSRLLVSVESIGSEVLRTNGTLYILLAKQIWSTAVAPFWTRYNPLRTQSLVLVPLGSMQLSVFTARASLSKSIRISLQEWKFLVFSLCFLFFKLFFK